MERLHGDLIIMIKSRAERVTENMFDGSTYIASNACFSGEFCHPCPWHDASSSLTFYGHWNIEGEEEKKKRREQSRG